MSWFRLSLRAEAKQSPIDGEIASAVRPRNDEVTDPGIDIYIPPRSSLVGEGTKVLPPPSNSLPQGEGEHRRHLPKSENVKENGPIRWAQQLLFKRRALEAAKEIIAKVELLSQSPDGAIRYFFDNDLPTLVQVSQRYPALVQKMLNEKLENSPSRQLSEPWYRLVQVACGDAAAILPALDGLC